MRVRTMQGGVRGCPCVVRLKIASPQVHDYLGALVDVHPRGAVDAATAGAMTVVAFPLHSTDWASILRYNAALQPSPWGVDTREWSSRSIAVDGSVSTTVDV